jgi:protein SCO1/2
MATPIRNRAFTLMLACTIAGAISAISGCGHGDSRGSYSASNPSDCLPDIALVDQHGREVSLASLKGQPVLIDFIYTTCASTCPMLTQRLTNVAHKLGPALGADVRIVSITLDPEHDTPDGLARYAKEQGAAANGWLFLTGKPENIDAELERFGLRRRRESDGSITHNVAAYLLGPDGRQIRQYNALDVPIDTMVSDLERAVKRG